MPTQPAKGAHRVTRAARPGGIAGGAVIANARENLGIPYVWGGGSRAGFDCSGFTQYVLRAAGKTIPRTAEAQRRAASRVNGPRPGDLVFFGAPAHHVGIYAGDGKATQKAAIWSSNATYGRF